jgi:hypothetical protein
MTELEHEISLASKLPLLDAAYSLWRYTKSPSRPKDDAFGFRDGGSPGAIDSSSLESYTKTLSKAFRSAIAAITFREANAHLGPAFHWLKRAHPDADDGALQNAIRASVKFDQDCVRFFAYNSKDYIEDVVAAINRASSNNPGFTEPTLQSARSHLSREMR